MIRKDPAGVSPTVTIGVNGVPINYNDLSSISMNFQENAHDTCSFSMSGVPSRFITDYTGMSINAQISLGSTFFSNFYGTIEVSTPEADTSSGRVNNSLFQSVTFTALGCSRVMRGSTSKNWHGYSLEGVARYFCDKYGFSLDVPADPLVFSTLLQSTESDWEFLVRYCSFMGYSVTVNGTHMHIYDPFKAKGRQISLHRLFTPAKTSPAPYPGQVVNFNGNFAQRAFDGRYFDTTVTVQPDSGITYDLHTSDIESLDTPATYNHNIISTVGNYAEAARMLQSQYRQNYDYRATVAVLGAPGILPGGMINLDSYGGSFDGLWYVTSVQQDVKSGSFLTTVEIRRNKTDTLTDTSAATFQQPPPPQFISGQWTTTNRRVNVY